MSELMCQTAIFTRMRRCFDLTCDQLVLLLFCLLAEETHRKKTPDRRLGLDIIIGGFQFTPFKIDQNKDQNQMGDYS